SVSAPQSSSSFWVLEPGRGGGTGGRSPQRYAPSSFWSDERRPSGRAQKLDGGSRPHVGRGRGLQVRASIGRICGGVPPTHRWGLTVLRSLLVALDGSPHSEAASVLACEWATRFGARLLGLGVLDRPSIEHGEAVPMGAYGFKKHRDEVR